MIILPCIRAPEEMVSQLPLRANVNGEFHKEGSSHRWKRFIHHHQESASSRTPRIAPSWLRAPTSEHFADNSTTIPIEVFSYRLKENTLDLSPGKSTATLLTLWTKEVNYQIDIVIGNIRVPTVKQPRILGVTFDQLLTFNRHASKIKDKLQSKNNVLQTLVGSTWGKDKETLVRTNKAITRPSANYQAPQDYIRQETSILPIKEHPVMITAQYTLKCHHEPHPNHHHPSQNIRKTALEYRDCENLLSPPKSPHNLRRGLRRLHTKSYLRL